MKFRSWNKEFERFCYFEDGSYYFEKIIKEYFIECKENNIRRLRKAQRWFNWQNAEECYYENLHIPETIYKNDIGVIEYEIEPYHDEKGYHNVKQIKGVVGLDLFKGLYVEKDNKKYYVNDYEDSFFISIGNIHEGKNNETI